MKNCLDSDWLRAVQFLVDKVKKTRKKFLLKCCEWQCTETMQFCRSIKCEICFHVLTVFDWRRPNLLSALHEFWEDNIWSIQDTTAWNMTRLGQLLYFTSQTTKISRYVLLSKFCMLSAIVLLGWRCEKWTNLVLTGTENNRAISFIQKCPRGM